MADVVLDSSAILALLNNEPGSEAVLPLVPGAHASTLIVAEVLTKLVATGVSIDLAASGLRTLNLTIHAFTAADAAASAELCLNRGFLKVSLADRCCLVLARRLRMPAVTGDRVWATLDAGVEIRLIR